MFRRHLDARRQGSDVMPIAWIDVHIEEHRLVEAARGGLSPLEMPGWFLERREWLFTEKNTMVGCETQKISKKHGFLYFVA